MQKKIPQATINRLPLYYRTLSEVSNSGQKIISSNELGLLLELTPEQIRKDLVFFGQFGMKGIGYYVEELMTHIGKILGLQHRWRLAIIGTNELGVALANYEGFAALGFKIAAIFDITRDKIGQEINNMRVYNFNNIKNIAPRKLLDIGVITVSAEKAQFVADGLIESGFKGIWNFSPVKLEVPVGISLVEEDLTFGLSTLSYRMAQRTR